MNNKTYYHLIIDKSGSMSSCVNETISGYNEQIQMIRDLQRLNPDQEILVSLTAFNHFVSHITTCSKPAETELLTRETYVPDGTTALLDAIGESVMSLKSRASDEFNNDKASAVVVIITDGYENASRFFSGNNVRNMIRELEATGKWTFSFLGADMAALEQAQNLNIQKANAASYSKADSGRVFEAMATSMDAYIFEKKAGRMKKSFLDKKDIDSEDLF
ncbi:MAG: hypothetical protein ACKOKB_10380 [Bacteroidota bacterium]